MLELNLNHFSKRDPWKANYATDYVEKTLSTEKTSKSKDKLCLTVQNFLNETLCQQDQHKFLLPARINVVTCNHLSSKCYG